MLQPAPGGSLVIARAIESRGVRTKSSPRASGFCGIVSCNKDPHHTLLNYTQAVVAERRRYRKLDSRGPVRRGLFSKRHSSGTAIVRAINYAEADEVSDVDDTGVNTDPAPSAARLAVVDIYDGACRCSTSAPKKKPSRMCRTPSPKRSKPPVACRYQTGDADA